MNHMIAKNPQAVRDGQEVGNHTSSPRSGGTVGGSAGQMVVLESGPFHGNLPKKEANPSNVVLCLGCYLY